MYLLLHADVDGNLFSSNVVSYICSLLVHGFLEVAGECM
jgi:hypothetical protein